ncbi:MAG: adenosylcobinamide-GDP ribazoletransferase, partial [Methanobrevibacter sp.]|nr:adenosylcobinamide-GDP ribazoletransferase [Methanobrevibacter sp.]
TALTSEPLTPGIGSYFILSTNSLNYALSTVIVAVIAYLLGGVIGLIGLLGAIFAGFIISVIAKKNFNVANGDVLGMSNEVGRLMALLFMSIALYFL